MEAAQAVREKRVRIHPSFKDLLAQLSAITFNDKGHPDKKRMSFDLGDALLIGIHALKESKITIVKVGNFRGSSYYDSPTHTRIM